MSQLQDQVSDVLRNYFGEHLSALSLSSNNPACFPCDLGSRWLNNRQAEVELMTHILYFSLTSLRGEYAVCGLCYLFSI